jgi:two-component system OmpR family sensor kinase/two-component system sensor histidine kinase BaeS
VKRLWVRLTAAFVIITLVGVASVSLLADVNAGNQFRQYLVRQNDLAQSSFVDDLAAYYQQHGSWNGVADLFPRPAPPRQGGGPQSRFRGPFFALLADASGNIVYDPGRTRQGTALSARDRENAVAIDVDGSTVGYLLAIQPGPPPITQPDQAFLDQLRRNLLVAALAAGGAAIVLGLFISRTLASPLAHLAGAARAFAAHDWSRRVKIGGVAETAEIAEVAHAFNDMADALQRAETLRRNMTADIAHELRTPLTVLQGNLQALLDGVYPLESKELAILYDQTRLLSRLVDDLRDLALAESGRLPFKFQALDPAAIIRTVAANFAAAVDGQQVTLRTDVPVALPPVHADADRLAQVLHNLLSNALRHTPSSGVITIAVALLADAARPMVQISVQDTGDGIAPPDLPFVFERFYRGDKSRARQGAGAGLGLAIAKSLVEAMGGTIGVESTPGKGSHFTFTLPVAAVL